MRKAIFALAALIFFNTSFAQLAKRTWLIGGNGMYSTSKMKIPGGSTSSHRDLTFEPNIGYFVIDRFAAGIGASGHFTNAKYPQVDGTVNYLKQTQIGMGPFARYYFLNPEKTINVFSSASALYWVNTNNNTSETGKEIYYAFGAGAEVFFNSAVGLELLLEYNKFNTLNWDDEWSTSGLQFKIGFQFHLEKE